MTLAPRICTLLLTITCSVSAGCQGSDQADRLPLHGTVHVSGALVTEGSIALLPESGHTGPAASTAITEGQYEFTEATGPVAGPHRVVVGVAATEETAGAAQPAADQPASSTMDPKSAAAARGATKGAGGARAGGADPSATFKQWETSFEVPESGDHRADFEFGT